MRTILSLNGLWELEPGGREPLPERFSHRVPVPCLVDGATPSYDWDQWEFHWYRHVFSVGWERGADLVLLRIDQSQYGTEVWLNGRNIGGTICCYTSHEYNLEGLIDYERANELVVRVGARRTLPPESAVGKDQEKDSFIPGIWGDVSLVLCGSPRIKLIQIIPHIDTCSVEARITVENLSSAARDIHVATCVLEKRGNSVASEKLVERLKLGPQREAVVVFHLPINNAVLWSPDSPFLYQLETSVSDSEKPLDQTFTTFGLRRFEVAGSDFLLNGKRIFLKGSNIAFHRFLSDPDRGTLPWNAEWIKRVLIDIPKEHSFNFFRNHLGQMYNLWYDIADEYGMLIQNEWQFWGTTGTKDQIRREFTQWLRDNWNHPSIVVWDALNESNDEVLQEEIVPEMKKLDPTRPWESADFIEQHPYIYSLGPVLNDRTFGYGLALQEIEQLRTPSVVNEFLWWWLDNEGRPTNLTEEVVERWLGRGYTSDDLLHHQAFLAQELVELFRRMRVDAIQPFVYLSDGDGPTGHWFLGSIAHLKPKPILSALKNAFSPFGISLELWDRHFFADERRTIRLFIFNDEHTPRRGVVRFGFVGSGGEWMSSNVVPAALGGGEYHIEPLDVLVPSEDGTYILRAELLEDPYSSPIAFSEKITHVFSRVQVGGDLRSTRIVVFDPRGEIAAFLESLGLPFQDFDRAKLDSQDLFIVGEGGIGDKKYLARIVEITNFVAAGHVVTLVEAEYGVDGKQRFTVVKEVDLAIERRLDSDRGGYDSYVFADDQSHPLWTGIQKDHLKLFNGAFGGEVVSQHNVIPLALHTVLARCGIRLGVIAVAEVPFGKGRVILSRLQVRGRLTQSPGSDGLYGRRIDPVAQQYFLNLLSYAASRTRKEG